MPTKKTAKQHVNPIIIIIPSQLGEDDDKNKRPGGKHSNAKQKSTKTVNSTPKAEPHREKRSASNQDNAVKHFCLSMLWTYMNVVSFDFVLEEEFVFVCF